MSGAQQFPWATMMELGLRVLGWSPRDFWAATPRELAAAFPARAQDVPPRRLLDDLMNQFPDTP